MLMEWWRNKAKGEEGKWEEVGRRGPGRRRGRVSVRPSVGREDALGEGQN